MGKSSVVFNPIGVVHSEHKFANKTPIQPVYASDCIGSAEIFPEFAEGLSDLEGFSHIYLIFQFHLSDGYKLKVKPFLQNVERGVFATRAPVRPNPVGLSTVELLSVEGNILHLKGVDMLDGTPLLDIKPYSGFDYITNSKNGWLDEVDRDVAAIKGRREFDK